MRVKRIIDLSRPFAEGGYNNPAFPDGAVDICMRHDVEGWHAETIVTATHNGTHIDAPLHKIKDGKSLDRFPLDRFIGEAVVIDLYDKKQDSEITFNDVFAYDSLIRQGRTVLLCTGWTEKLRPESKEEYLFHSPWLGRQAAEYLVMKKVNAVGIDHFSIGGANPGNVEIPHDILLASEVLIWEGMNLPRVLLEKKIWFVVALPIFIKNASGAPARIAAVEFSDSFRA